MGKIKWLSYIGELHSVNDKFNLMRERLHVAINGVDRVEDDVTTQQLEQIQSEMARLSETLTRLQNKRNAGLI
jgi:hypothetical protein